MDKIELKIFEAIAALAAPVSCGYHATENSHDLAAKFLGAVALPNFKFGRGRHPHASWDGGWVSTATGTPTLWVATPYGNHLVCDTLSVNNVG